MTAAEAAKVILDGVKANRWRILVGTDAHKIDEMVRQSPDRAYDIAFFDEFARAPGWTERLSLETPTHVRRIDHRTTSGRCAGICAPAMRRSEASVNISRLRPERRALSN